MKKVTLLLLGVVAAFASCSNDDNYAHTFYLTQPHTGQAILYADATADTIRLTTTDNFTATSSQPWMRITGGSENPGLEYAYTALYCDIPIYLAIEPNTTGRNRKSLITILTQGLDDWSQTAGVEYTQLSWLNITSPAPKYTFPEGVEQTWVNASCHFLRTDSATQEKDSLVFFANGPWRIEADGARFAHPEKTEGEAKTHIVFLNLDENVSLSDTISDTLTLISAGVATPIVIRKTPKKGLR